MDFGMLASKENPLGCPKLTYEPRYSNKEIWKFCFGHIHCVSLGWIVRGRKLVFKIALALAVRVLVNNEGKRVCASVVLYGEAHVDQNPG